MVGRIGGGGEAGPGAGFFARIGSPYKPGQGIHARRALLFAGLGFAFWGAADLWAWTRVFDSLRAPFWQGARLPFGGVPVDGGLVVAVVVFAAGAILVGGALKTPRFADLLIETESEMKKVSWPSLPEAWGNTVVVAVVMVLFAVVLLVFDLVIQKVFRQLFALEV